MERNDQSIGMIFLVRRRHIGETIVGNFRKFNFNEPDGWLLAFFILLRAAIPRPRYDQLMTLGWKVMLPLGLVNLVAVATANELTRLLDPRQQSTAVWLGMIALSWAVFLGAGVVLALCGPMVADNRPRGDLAPYEIDSQI